MKSLITKLFAVLFIALLTVGCASSLTAPRQNIEKQHQTVQKADSPQTGDAARNEGVRSARPRPDL